MKRIQIIILLSLLIYCNPTNKNVDKLKRVKDTIFTDTLKSKKTTNRGPFSGSAITDPELIEDIINRAGLPKDKYGYNVREYLNGYVLNYSGPLDIQESHGLKKNVHTTTFFFNPDANTTKLLDGWIVYEFYKNHTFKPIDDSREYLEELLLVETFRGSVFDGPNQIIDKLTGKPVLFYENINNFIKKYSPCGPKVIKMNNGEEKHVFYVLKTPFKGSTIYKYELLIKYQKMSSGFDVTEIACLGNKWGLR
jgi:hypothetical protein